MNDMVGLPAELIEGANRHLSSGTLGEFFAGSMIDAMANGFVYGFNNSFLLPDTVGATLTPVKVTGASGVATEEIYHLWGEKGYLRARTLSDAAGGVAAANGVAASSTHDTVARGVYRFVLGDVDADSCSAIDQAADTWLPFGVAGQDFTVSFGIAGTANLDQAATVGNAEFGLTDSAVDLDPANAIATNYFVFKLENNRIYFTDGTTSVNCGKIPTTRFILTIEYNQKANLINCFVNGQHKGSISRGSVAGAQISARVSHLAAYLALNDDPISVDLDYVIANTPNIRPSGRA